MKRISYLILLFLLFLFSFALSRAIFLCYFSSAISSQPLATIAASFYYGLKTDISTACYLLLFPLLILIADTTIPFQYSRQINRFYAGFILFINALITSAELGLYQEWGVKMNYKALLYLQHPTEIIQTATTTQFIVTILLTILQLLIGWTLYWKLINPSSQKDNGNRSSSSLLLISLIPLLILGIRGGIQQIPVQAADSYYSTNPHLNWAAVNSLWSFGQSIAAGTEYGHRNPYAFLSVPDARKNVDKLYTTNSDSSTLFLKNTNPNIVLIIFEGWSADLVASISENRERSCAPNFDRLASEGILFTNCLASGERSDQGVTAILSAFPSLPLSSIVNYPEKVNHLPSLLKPFKDRDYSSLFLFGGQLSYGNLKTLIYHNGFDKVIEEKDIDPKIYRGRLGVHDEHTFDLLLHQLHGMKTPFFSGFFTQSTHFSYDYPGVKKSLPWAGNESDYANSVMYADSCLGDFFAKAKKEPWYVNTLFIMVSDHSHVLPWNDNHQTAAMHHIPLLFYGDVIKDEYRGMKQRKIVSQQDIAATLLSQLHMPHENFKWSKDVMNSTDTPFAYWTFTEGFGFSRDKDCEMVYDLANKKYVSSSYSGCDSNQVKTDAKSYLQTVLTDFLSR